MRGEGRTRGRREKGVKVGRGENEGGRGEEVRKRRVERGKKGRRGGRGRKRGRVRKRRGRREEGEEGEGRCQVEGQGKAASTRGETGRGETEEIRGGRERGMERG